MGVKSAKNPNLSFRSFGDQIAPALLLYRTAPHLPFLDGFQIHEWSYKIVKRPNDGRGRTAKKVHFGIGAHVDLFRCKKETNLRITERERIRCRLDLNWKMV